MKSKEQTKRNFMSYLKEYKWIFMAAFAVVGCFAFMAVMGPDAMAQEIPGEDRSGQLEMAGTTLRIVDKVLFTWIAPLLAGVFVIVAGVWIKDQKYSLAAMAFIAALLLGTAGTWVQQIFSIGGEGAGGVFQEGRIVVTEDYGRIA